jgi:hypothetical protein
MANTSFAISTYEVTLFRDGTGAGASSSFDSVIYLFGEGNTVYLHFLNSGQISSTNVWFPSQKFGRIFMHGALLPVVIDMLRNEKKIYCLMSDTVPGQCQISTSPEPVGEGEAIHGTV